MYRSYNNYVITIFSLPPSPRCRGGGAGGGGAFANTIHALLLSCPYGPNSPRQVLEKPLIFVDFLFRRLSGNARLLQRRELLFRRLRMISSFFITQHLI